jgi:hypothetical protein
MPIPAAPWLRPRRSVPMAVLASAVVLLTTGPDMDLTYGHRPAPAAAAVHEQEPAQGDAAVLDWRDPCHFSPRRARCRYHCGGRTWLRDDDGRPAHKVCAEKALAATEAARTEGRLS